MYYYLLLYKIKSNHLLWIVNRDLNLDELFCKIDSFDNFKTYTSDIDQYYIIKQKYCDQKEIEKIFELELKQFTLFRIDKNSELVFKTN